MFGTVVLVILAVVIGVLVLAALLGAIGLLIGLFLCFTEDYSLADYGILSLIIGFCFFVGCVSHSNGKAQIQQIQQAAGSQGINLGDINLSNGTIIVLGTGTCTIKADLENGRLVLAKEQGQYIVDKNTVITPELTKELCAVN